MSHNKQTAIILQKKNEDAIESQKKRRRRRFFENAETSGVEKQQQTRKAPKLQNNCTLCFHDNEFKDLFFERFVKNTKNNDIENDYFCNFQIDCYINKRSLKNEFLYNKRMCFFEKRALNKNVQKFYEENVKQAQIQFNAIPSIIQSNSFCQLTQIQIINNQINFDLSNIVYLSPIYFPNIEKVYFYILNWEVAEDGGSYLELSQPLVLRGFVFKNYDNKIVDYIHITGDYDVKIHHSKFWRSGVIFNLGKNQNVDLKNVDFDLGVNQNIDLKKEDFKFVPGIKFIPGNAIMVLDCNEVKIENIYVRSIHYPISIITCNKVMLQKTNFYSNFKGCAFQDIQYLEIDTFKIKGCFGAKIYEVQDFALRNLQINVKEHAFKRALKFLNSYGQIEDVQLDHIIEIIDSNVKYKNIICNFEGEIVEKDRDSEWRELS